MALHGAIADPQSGILCLQGCHDQMDLAPANLIFRRWPDRSVDAGAFAVDAVMQGFKLRYRERLVSADRLLYFAMEPGALHCLPGLPIC